MNYNYLIKNKNVDFAAAVAAGFAQDADDPTCYVLRRNLPNGLVVTIRLSSSTLDVDVFDSIFNERYAPFYGGHGGAAIKSEVREIVDAALQKCTQTVNLKQQITQWLIETYGAQPESPWDEYPTYYTFKTAKSQKWYALFMDIPAKSLSLDGDQMVSVVNVKAAPEFVAQAPDNAHLFPAYHMNKKHWLTILLNATTDVSRLKQMLADSYALSDGKKAK